MDRRTYPIFITINGRQITQVVIDPHYEVRHKDSINDSIIIELVKTLDGAEQLPESIDENGFEYYVSNKIPYQQKRTGSSGYYTIMKCLSELLMLTGGIKNAIP